MKITKTDKYWLKSAIEYGERHSEDPEEIKVGCILTDFEGLWIGSGANRFPAVYLFPEDKLQYKNDLILHAEMDALMNKSVLSEPGTAYVTMAPCSVCSRLLADAGFYRVIYSKVHKKSALHIMDLLGIRHQLVEITEE